MNPHNPNPPSSNHSQNGPDSSPDEWDRFGREDRLAETQSDQGSRLDRHDDLFLHMDAEHDHEWHQAQLRDSETAPQIGSDPWPYDTKPEGDQGANNTFEFDKNVWQEGADYDNYLPHQPEPNSADYLDDPYEGYENSSIDPPPVLDTGTYAPQTDEPFSYVSPAKPVKDRAPITLLLSAIFLVLLLISVVVFYKSDINEAALKEIGTPLGDFGDEVVEEAKPLNNNEMKDVIGVQMRPSIGLESETVVSKSASSSVSSVSKSTPEPVAQSTKSSLETSSQSASIEALPVIAKPVTSGTASVQIGAFNSREVANTQFDKVSRKYGSQLSGTVRKIDVVTVGGTTYYRASIAGFATKDLARSFCDSLKSSGQDCILK